MTTEAAEIIAKWGQPTHRVAASPDRIARFREMVPDLLLLLWAEFGFSGFADGLWWLCDPVAWQDAVDVWIPRANLEIGEDDWIAVSRGAFGRLSLWGRRTGMSLEIVPHLGAVYQHDESANMATPRQRDEQLREALMTPSRYTFDVTGQDGDGLFDRALRAHGQVGPDTVYGFFPALAIGGPARVDRIEVVDAAVHLDLLAQMTPRQVFPDTTELLRWHCVEGDQTGLAGRRARLLTKEPTDDAGYPADLPPGTRQVVIVDDTPNPTLTLRVQTLGDHPVAAYVRFDQLAVRDEDPVETGVEDAVQVAFQLLRKAGIQTTVDGQPSSYPHRARSDEIAQILASACPPGWQSLQAAFSMAGGQEIIQVVALTPGGPVNVAVPLRAAELAREHRVMTAGAAGPWLRMLMELNSAGRLQMSFDYGDVPLPAGRACSRAVGSAAVAAAVCTWSAACRKARAVCACSGVGGVCIRPVSASKP